MGTKNLDDVLLPGISVERIRAAYGAAPGNELDSGKFLNPESSACLVANVFGWFLDRPADVPALPGTAECGWPAQRIELEEEVRFPWAGGRHPCLDVVIETKSAFIGVESKRYEPFRSKNNPDLSEAYWRAVWGPSMARYEATRDRLRDGTAGFKHLDAAQLVKHAFGLRSAVHRAGSAEGKRPVLVYLYAEPKRWGGGEGIELSRTDVLAHRTEVAAFAASLEGDEVQFRSLSYESLLTSWRETAIPPIRAHASAVANRFDLY